MLKNEDGVTESVSRELDKLSHDYGYSSDVLQTSTAVDSRTLDALLLMLTDPDDSSDTTNINHALSSTTTATTAAVANVAPTDRIVAKRVLSGTHSSGSSPATSAHLTTSYDSAAPDPIASTAAVYSTMPVGMMTISSTSAPPRRGSDPRDTASSSDSVSESILKFEVSVASIMSAIMNFVPAVHSRASAANTYASRALPTPVAPGSPFVKSHRERDPNAPGSPVVHHRSVAAPQPPLSPVSSPPLSPRRQRCERCGLPNGRTITPYVNEPSEWRCLCLQCSLLLNSVPTPPQPPVVETEFEAVPPLPPLPHNWSETQM